MHNDPAREERQTDILTAGIFLLREIPTFPKWFCLLIFVFSKQPMVRGEDVMTAHVRKDRLIY